MGSVSLPWLTGSAVPGSDADSGFSPLEDDAFLIVEHLCLVLEEKVSYYLKEETGRGESRLRPTLYYRVIQRKTKKLRSGLERGLIDRWSHVSRKE